MKLKEKSSLKRSYAIIGEQNALVKSKETNQLFLGRGLACRKLDKKQ